jgi:hydroxypyruvate reductase
MIVSLKRDLLQIGEAALRAVDPGRAVRQLMHWNGLDLQIDRGELSPGGELPVVWPMQDVARVFLVAGGKAAMPMTMAAAEILGESLTEGIVVTKYEHATGYEYPANIKVWEAGHPIPDAAGVQGTETIGQLLDGLTKRDRVLVLLSGGASALWPAPVSGLSLLDLQTTTDLLLRAGATIDELNVVRKHLSRLKGGQLARCACPAPLTALILSDVVGDPLDVIASGPTTPDPTTYADAWQVLERYALLKDVPSAVRTHLQAGQAGQRLETPKPGDPLFEKVTNVVVGSNRIAANGAVMQARRLGYQALLLTTFVEGEAREVAKVAAALAKGIVFCGDPIPAPACLVWGGETTVTVHGSGKGGRNQELALAAAMALENVPGAALMALATDGTDGPTDAAGAIVDGCTLQALQAMDIDPRAVLSNNNSYSALDAVDALMRTGPTGTNVNDLLVILVADQA